MLVHRRECDICGATVPEGVPTHLPIEGFDGKKLYDLCPKHLRDVWVSISEDLSAEEGRDILAAWGLDEKGEPE